MAAFGGLYRRERCALRRDLHLCVERRQREPDRFARITWRASKSGAIAGSGCGSSQYAQLNANAFSGPTYNSTGNESGSSLFNYCFNNTADLAVQRSFGVFGEKRRISFRLDAFNVFNIAVINAVNNTIQLASPAAASTATNNQFLSTGALNTGRVTAQNAGFGAATGAHAHANAAGSGQIHVLT